MYYVFKDLLIDAKLRKVVRAGTSLDFSDLSFSVLLMLIEKAPTPVDFKQSTNEIWQTDYVSDETIAQRLAIVRKALGDSTKEPVYIRTVRGKGYALTDVPEKADSETESRTNIFASYKTPIIAATLGMAILVSLVLGTYYWRSVFPSSNNINQLNPKSEIDLLIERAQEQMSLRQSTETDRAISMLRQALLEEPQNYEARLSLSFALSNKTTKFGGGKTEEYEAEKIARELTEERPNNTDAWSALGYSLGSQGRLEESLSAFERAYQIDPQNASAMSSAAHTHQVQGDLYRSLSLDVTAREFNTVTSRYSEIQIAHTLELIDHPAYENWYNKALLLNPAQSVVLIAIAHSYLRSGNPERASELLSHVSKSDQLVPQVLALRGRVSLMLGNVEEARKYLSAAGKNGQFGLAIVDAMSGNTSTAYSLLAEDSFAMREADTWPPTGIQLAEVAITIGARNRSIQFIQKAITLGWRDLKWLKQSPFLTEIMLSDVGAKIEERIKQDLTIQKSLIDGDEKLTASLAL
jgi:DNA-binding winged helix-turn-helix (wHTH) protein/tetratricopeptide (TPR) repeat protein